MRPSRGFCSWSPFLIVVRRTTRSRVIEDLTHQNMYKPSKEKLISAGSNTCIVGVEKWRLYRPTLKMWVGWDEEGGC